MSIKEIKIFFATVFTHSEKKYNSKQANNRIRFQVLIRVIATLSLSRYFSVKKSFLFMILGLLVFQS
jgi:hypothetical protein